jgi:hypothetical protein
MRKTNDRNFLRIVRQAEELELKDIRLVEAHCKLGNLKENELPTIATQRVGIGIQLDSKSGTAIVLADYSLGISYPDSDSEQKEQPVSLKARFGLHYALGKKRANSKVIEGALRHAGAAVSSLYWKELAQSMTVRMGLPPFPIPSFGSRKLVRNTRKK